MKNKIIIGLILILVSSTNAFSCLMASQDRIIPIGTSENCLIGIEIISYRFGAGEFGAKAVWNYKVTLKGFNEDYSDYLIGDLNNATEIEEIEIEQFLNRQISRAMRICTKLNDFELLEPKEISFCDFQKSCSSLELEESQNELKFKVNSSSTSYSIKYLDEAYKGEIAKPYKEYFEFYFDDSKHIVGKDLSISSIRIYENSKHKLLIFHLGTGQEFEDVETGNFPTKKEYKFEKELKTVADAVFIEPILHHGKGFDYFRMDKK